VAKDFKLEVSVDSINQLLASEIWVEVFLADIFNNKASHAIISERLASYFYDDGGSPEVRGFEIVNAKFNNDNLRGTFQCNFTVYYFFTCSDVKNDKKENITWQFKINPADGVIAFEGEEPWIIE
jgi:hypothetical protein